MNFVDQYKCSSISHLPIPVLIEFYYNKPDEVFFKYILTRELYNILETVHYDTGYLKKNTLYRKAIKEKYCITSNNQIGI